MNIAPMTVHDKNSRRGRLKVLNAKLATNPQKGEFDAFDKNLLEFSMIASDRQWCNTIGSLERQVDAMKDAEV